MGKRRKLFVARGVEGVVAGSTRADGVRGAKEVVGERRRGDSLVKGDWNERGDKVRN